MPIQLEIRPAREPDARVIAEFNVAMAHETEGRTLSPETVWQGVLGLMARPDSGAYLVAEQAGTIVGCLLITYEWSDWRNGNFWWIQSVYVPPTSRRRGIFRRLYHEVRRRAEQAGNVCGLRLYVEQGNQAAQRTYAQLGMQETPYRVFEQELGGE